MKRKVVTQNLNDLRGAIKRASQMQQSFDNHPLVQQNNEWLRSHQPLYDQFLEHCRQEGWPICTHLGAYSSMYLLRCGSPLDELKAELAPLFERDSLSFWICAVHELIQHIKQNSKAVMGRRFAGLLEPEDDEEEGQEEKRMTDTAEITLYSPYTVPWPFLDDLPKLMCGIPIGPCFHILGHTYWVVTIVVMQGQFGFRTLLPEATLQQCMYLPTKFQGAHHPAFRYFWASQTTFAAGNIPPSSLTAQAAVNQEQTFFTKAKKPNATTTKNKTRTQQQQQSVEVLGLPESVSELLAKYPLRRCPNGHPRCLAFDICACTEVLANRAFSLFPAIDFVPCRC